MILEQTEGDLVITLEGKRLVVGTDFDNSKYSMVVVLGKGKAIFRVDPSITIEQKGVEILEAMGKGTGIPAIASVQPAEEVQ